ncbi:TrmH family RNA methyltransferase [Saccharicrinis sp. FJH54]|uniref:TrmH family RNA methyltransferase n=1 Tax=Saccharicrinis sp. FJH54 TaxID=3344665 RepID=UPI0035D480D2
MFDPDLIQYLTQFLTDERNAVINRVLAERTRYITVVLEDIFQSQNASAVLRTCDCFGVQDVHIIENYNEYDVNPDVALGSDKWLTMHKYNGRTENTANALKQLKNEGYRIIATTPHTNDILLEDFNLEEGRFALVFGTEQSGISNTVEEYADAFLRIPMYGFTESYNISVSAAICLHDLVKRLKAGGINWQLTTAESNALKYEWLTKTIKKSDLILERYNKERTCLK